MRTLLYSSYFRFSMEIQSNYSLQALNSFGLSVKAEYYCEVTSINEFKALMEEPRYSSLPKLVLGGGSNVLFIDDFHGLVIHNKIAGICIVEETETEVLITSGGGVNWHQFVMHCVDKGYGGIENLSLIPGNVGAAPIQNIGAYGVEVKDTFHQLTAIDLQDGSIHKFNNAECEFGYRDSIFKRGSKNKFIIVDVTFRLSKQAKLSISYGAIKEELNARGIEHPTIKNVSDAVIAIRQSKLPDPAVIGNAGSFFKNPEIASNLFDELKKNYPEIVGYKTENGKIKVAAGWLIEKCGWKGKRVGEVGMHAKQALVLVNYGKAKGEELILHAQHVQESVREKFGIMLEMEVNIIS